MSELMVVLVVLAALGGAFVFYVGRVRPHPRIDREEDARIRFLWDRIRTAPAELGPYLELSEIHRRHNDRDSLFDLVVAGIPHLARDPSFERLTRSALSGLTFGADVLAEPSSFAQSVRIDRSADRLCVDQGFTLVDGWLEVTQLRLEVDRFLAGGRHSASGMDRCYRVVHAEARIPRERLARLGEILAMSLGPNFARLELSLGRGDIALQGQLYIVPFRLEFRVKPASDRLIHIHIPRPVQVAGWSIVPAASVVGRLVDGLSRALGDAITRISGSSFLIDLTRLLPYPILPNVSTVEVSPDALVIVCDEKEKATLDPNTWENRTVPKIAGAEILDNGTVDKTPVPRLAFEVEDPRVVEDPRIEMRAAGTRGDFPRALDLATRLLSNHPNDSLVREETAELALLANDPARTVEIVQGGLTLTGRLRLLGGQALLRLGRRIEATALLTGLEEHLCSSSDLVWHAEMCVAGLSDKDAAREALSRLLDDSQSPDILCRAIQVSWDAGDPRLTLALATRLIRIDPLDPTAYRFVGLARQKLDEPSERVNMALLAARHLAPSRPPNPSLAIPSPAPAGSSIHTPPSSKLETLVHPLERSSLGSALRKLRPELLERLAEDDCAPPPTFLKATPATHPSLHALVAQGAAALGCEVPEIVIDPRPGHAIRPVAGLKPRIQLHGEVLTLWSKEELTFALARALWQITRGDLSFPRLDSAKSALALLLTTLRCSLFDRSVEQATQKGSLVQRFRALTHRFQQQPPVLAPSAVIQDVWASILPADVLEDTVRQARSLARPVTPEDVEEWLLAVELSADRAAFCLCGDLGGALGALVWSEFPPTVVDEIRERGLRWAVHTLGSSLWSRRVRELLSYATLDHSPDSLD